MNEALDKYASTGSGQRFNYAFLSFVGTSIRRPKYIHIAENINILKHIKKCHSLPLKCESYGTYVVKWKGRNHKAQTV